MGAPSASMCHGRACLDIRSVTACCSAPTRCVSRPEALALALATHLDHPVDDGVRDAKLKVIAESFRDCWRPRWDFGTSLALTVGCYRSVHEGASPLDCCLADLGAYTNLPVAAVLGKTEACGSATSPTRR